MLLRHFGGSFTGRAKGAEDAPDLTVAEWAKRTEAYLCKIMRDAEDKAKQLPLTK